MKFNKKAQAEEGGLFGITLPWWIWVLMTAILLGGLYFLLKRITSVG